jgi:hypothetical protein
MGLRILGAIVVALTGACGGGGDDVTSGTVQASFRSSNTATTPDQVRLVGGAASEDVVTVRVVLHGPTSTSDLFAFAFDLVVSDADAVQYVVNSARLGDALAVGPAGGEVLASQTGNRIVIGATKLGPEPGNGVGDGDHTILTLALRVRTRGDHRITFDGSPAGPQTDPVALGSTGEVLPEIVFDPAAATVSGT